MDDIWVILGSIVLMVLSSLSSAKKKKGGNTSSVDTEQEEQKPISEEDIFPMEDIFSTQMQEINNEVEEKFEANADLYQATERDIENDIVEEPKNEISNGNFNEVVEFDLRKAVIYSTILENPYIKTEKNK